MLNQFTIVGRLTGNPVFMTIDGKKIATITLAIARPYKNEEGVYETDFIECILRGQVAEKTSEYCKQGDVIGVQGHIENDYLMDGSRVMALNADKVTFLSSTIKQETVEGEE